VATSSKIKPASTKPANHGKPKPVASAKSGQGKPAATKSQSKPAASKPPSKPSTKTAVLKTPVSKSSPKSAPPKPTQKVSAAGKPPLKSAGGRSAASKAPDKGSLGKPASAAATKPDNTSKSAPAKPLTPGKPGKTLASKPVVVTKPFISTGPKVGSGPKPGSMMGGSMAAMSRSQAPLTPPPLPPAPVTTSDTKSKKNIAGLSHRELEGFRDLLLAKRRELVGDMRSMEADALLNSQSAGLSSLPVHMADMGTDNYEQEFTLGLVEKDRLLLREINVALAKIAAGSYGTCEGTGQPISKPRLEAQPWARHSIEYARALEKRKMRY
jgi:DnaK suppressor protein